MHGKGDFVCIGSIRFSDSRKRFQIVWCLPRICTVPHKVIFCSSDIEMFPGILVCLSVPF